MKRIFYTIGSITFSWALTLWLISTTIVGIEREHNNRTRGKSNQGRRRCAKSTNHGFQKEFSNEPKSIIAVVGGKWCRSFCDKQCQKQNWYFRQRHHTENCSHDAVVITNVTSRPCERISFNSVPSHYECVSGILVFSLQHIPLSVIASTEPEAFLGAFFRYEWALNCDN